MTRAPEKTDPEAPLEVAQSAVEFGAPRQRPLKILFFLRHSGYLRHYGEPIRLLAERGHTVCVAVGERAAERHAGDTQHLQPLKRLKDADDARLAKEVAARCPGVDFTVAPRRTADDRWRTLAWLIRGLLDLSRYSDPRYADAGALRDRIAGRLTKRRGEIDPLSAAVCRQLVGRLTLGTDARRAARFGAICSALERAMPTSRDIDRFIAERRPDVVLATPVVEFASSQVEYLKSARKLGITSVVCIASWDNLTNKGLVRVRPDRVLVWNEVQRRELEELHGIPGDRVVLTGAQKFDEWFGRNPATTPEGFAGKVGLNPEQPFLLYLCSSPFVAPDEVGFVERWLSALRDDGLLNDHGVLVRPHPLNSAQWDDVDLSVFGNVSIWPRQGKRPDAGEARDDFFDSLAHSRAVIGINTSAMIEAGIVGKSVHTVRAPEFERTQAGTLHYHYLRWENGGPVHEARSLEEHLGLLREALTDPAADAEQTHRFTEMFLRPHGWDEPATPRVVAAIEEAGSLPPPDPDRPSVGALGVRAAIYPLLVLMRATRLGQRAAGRMQRAGPAVRRRLRNRTVQRRTLRHR